LTGKPIAASVRTSAASFRHPPEAADAISLAVAMLRPAAFLLRA
jgi:hypothetical protein